MTDSLGHSYDAPPESLIKNAKVVELQTDFVGVAVDETQTLLSTI